MIPHQRAANVAGPLIQKTRKLDKCMSLRLPWYFSALTIPIIIGGELVCGIVGVKASLGRVIIFFVLDVFGMEVDGFAKVNQRVIRVAGHMIFKRKRCRCLGRDRP